VDKVYIRDLVKTILNYKYKILLICLVSVAFSHQLTVWMKKKYVSTFEINVYSKYFQNPLISGVIPDLYNMPEMRFAIDSMVKEAISDEFIDSIGNDYKIYDQVTDERELAKQRQLLRDNFSYYSTGGQSYSISFSNADPYVAKEISEKTMKVVKEHIINKRIKTIELVKEVMIQKLNSFNASQKFVQQGADKAMASKSPDVLREELVKVTNSIEAMGKQYKDFHPVIRNLKSRQKVITQWLSEYDISKFSGAVDLPMAMSHDKVVSEQLSSKFYAKYHDFNIALDIEKKSLDSYIGMIKSPQLPTAPVWPKKRLFLSLGFVLGLVISFIYVYMCEIIIPSTEEKLQAESELLGAPVLGFMPSIKAKVPRTKVTVNDLEEIITVG
jgi:hypothetical protein